MVTTTNISEENYTKYGLSKLQIRIDPIPRERMFKENLTNKITLNPNEIALAITARNKLITTIEDKTIYFRGHFDNLYKPIGKIIIEQELSYASAAYDINISINKRREIINEVKNLTYVNKDIFVEHNQDMIHVQNLKNGVLFIEIPKFIPHVFDYSVYDPSNYEKYFKEYTNSRQEFHFLSQKPLIYDTKCNCPHFLTFLKEILPDKQDRETIFELFGYCLINSYPIQKFFLLVGEGANGKTTLLAVLEKFLGHNNVTNCSLNQLLERFGAANLYLKSANIQGDLDSRNIKNLGVLKDIVSGAWLTAEFKGRTHFEFQNTAKIIIPCNKVPRPKESDLNFSYYRRVNIIRFNKIIPYEEQIPQHKILENIASDEELSGILNLAIEGLVRLLKTNKFSNFSKQGDLEKDLDKLHDSSEYFVNQFIYSDENLGMDWFVNDMYKVYTKWCKSQKLPKQTLKNLNKLIKTKLNNFKLLRKLNPKTQKKESYFSELCIDDELEVFCNKDLANITKSEKTGSLLRIRIERIMDINKTTNLSCNDIIKILELELPDVKESEVKEILKNKCYAGDIYEPRPGEFRKME